MLLIREFRFTKNKQLNECLITTSVKRCICSLVLQERNTFNDQSKGCINTLRPVWLQVGCKHQEVVMFSLTKLDWKGVEICKMTVGVKAWWKQIIFNPIGSGLTATCQKTHQGTKLGDATPYISCFNSVSFNK